METENRPYSFSKIKNFFHYFNFLFEINYFYYLEIIRRFVVEVKRSWTIKL